MNYSQKKNSQVRAGQVNFEQIKLSLDRSSKIKKVKSSWDKLSRTGQVGNH